MATCEEAGLTPEQCATAKRLGVEPQDYADSLGVAPAADAGTWTKPEKGVDGKWWQYNSKTGQFRESPPPPTTALEEDLFGLMPVEAPGERPQNVTDYQRIANSGRNIAQAISPDQTPYMTDQFGELYYRDGSPVPLNVRERLLGQLGGEAASDPYAGAANARAERALQEQIRAQRIREAQDASDAIQARMQAAQEARLAGAKFAVTPSMSGGYFPGLQPDSPIVRQGLAQPFQFQPVGFNPERGVNINEQQVANDLAMIRRVSGG